MKSTVILIILPMLISCCSLPARYNKKSTDENNTIFKASVPAENSELISAINEWLGTPYEYGGNTRQGIDCSGFTSLIMARVYKIDLPRSAFEQYKTGGHLRRGDLHVGDLVFFRDIRSRGIDHVGIYLGNDRFVHATESAGVIISNMSEEYYEQRFTGARRYNH